MTQHTSSRSIRSLLGIAGASALLFVAMTGVGRADLILVAPDVVALQGSTGSFDIELRNTNAPGGASYDVSADTIELLLAGSPGVTFTDATISTSFAYLFVTSGTTLPGGLPLSLDTFPNAGFLASDAEFDAQGFRTLGPGEIFGVVHVSYAVEAAAALGDRSLTFGAGTSLADLAGAPIPFATTIGTFTVKNGSVPEPGSLALLALGGMALLARRNRRRGRSA